MAIVMGLDQHRAQITAEWVDTVPGDVSVVGFDDIEEARRSSPPLTTIRQGLFEQGQNAAALALAMVAGDVALADEFPTELIVRASTSPPAAVHTNEPTTP